MAEEKIYEMLWDCEFCSSKKLLGKTHRHCPNCGATQDPARRYFPSDSEKVAVQDHVYFGADKVCTFCSTPNGAKAVFCGNCGGSLEGAKDVARRADQGVGVEDNVQAAKQDLENQKILSEGGTPPPAKEDLAFKDSKFIKPHPKTPKWVLWMLGSILFGTIGFICVGVLWTERVTLKVAKHEWSRSIDIERFKPVSDSSWCDSMPSNAYSVSRRSEVRSHRQVADGQECHTVRSDKGDGTYSESESCSTKYRSEPVYDSRCYYTIDKWAFERASTAKGIGVTEDPYWPNPQYQSCSGSIGCERLGAKKESYVVHFEEDSGETKGEKHDCDLDQAKWKQYNPKTLYQSDKSVIFNYITCDSIVESESIQEY
ncbi:zinc ribbon domain-containing protein [Leptospira ilyithenensis]|uniref:Zinc ribbon domain-containing protein n=1 Tax=Leptospira ilyithenensis TaxID=2484901 RepID=A0A4R9LPS1_9LEPT|nr:zinc ribbon domain-containing protein [Leptospira ilyithenensis]TGN11084.1 zinc ribbon domain-containing protein [Leptospira ilyithenensis]